MSFQFLTPEQAEGRRRVYETFADVQSNPSLPPEVRAVLAPGDTQVWYRREGAGSLTLPPPDPADLEATHVRLANVAGTDREELFVALNTWSPYGEANRIVGELGVHTSMSVGDVLVIDGKTHVCAGMGWDELD